MFLSQNHGWVLIWLSGVGPHEGGGGKARATQYTKQHETAAHKSRCSDRHNNDHQHNNHDSICDIHTLMESLWWASVASVASGEWRAARLEFGWWDREIWRLASRLVSTNLLDKKNESLSHCLFAFYHYYYSGMLEDSSSVFGVYRARNRTWILCLLVRGVVHHITSGMGVYMKKARQGKTYATTSSE